MLIAIFFTKFVKMNSVENTLKERNNEKTVNIETKQDSPENQIYQTFRFPNIFNLCKKRGLYRNREPVCRPVCEPRFRFRNRHEFDIKSESDSGSRPKCRPECRPGCRPECRPRFKFIHHRRRKNYWRPRCRPICGQSSESHSSSISYSRDSSSSEISSFIDCREREPVCRPVCGEQFRIMSNDQKHQRKLAPVCKPVCRPKSTHRFHKHIKRRWKTKYRPKWEQICKPVCAPKRSILHKPKKHNYKPKKKLYVPECKPVCVNKSNKHHESYSTSRDSESKYSSSEYSYEHYEPTCEPLDGQYRIMSEDNIFTRSRRLCRPICEPFQRSKFNRRFDDDCRPVCEPDCRPQCDPILRRRRRHRHVREVRNRNTGGSVTAIRQIILQASFEVNKLARFFAEEIKAKLLEGLQLIITGAGNKATGDFKKLEQRIADVVIDINKCILRDTDALITNTNEEILNILTMNIRNANKLILSDIAALVAATKPPQSPNKQPLDKILDILTNRFNEITIEVPNIFKKFTQTEKASIEKIVNDKKSEIIKEVTKLIEEFEKRLARLFADLAEEEIIFIRNILDQNARKLLVDLEHILQQIGEGIIIILKGRNCEFRPLLFGGEIRENWNVNQEENI